VRTQESRTHLRVSVKHLWCLYTIALDNCTRECDTRRFLGCSVAEIGCHSRARVERVCACSTTVGESSTKVVDIERTFSARVHRRAPRDATHGCVDERLVGDARARWPSTRRDPHLPSRWGCGPECVAAPSRFELPFPP
jgi:hypothetical protein